MHFGSNRIQTPVRSIDLDFYMSQVRAHKQLTHEESVELFKRYESGGAEAMHAKNKLVESNLRLVISIANSFKQRGVPLEDLVQEGNIGLIRSVEKYNWKLGFRFSTYATFWIKQAVRSCVQKNVRIIRTPPHALGLHYKILQMKHEFSDLFGCEPTKEELLALTGATEQAFDAALVLTNEASIISLTESQGDMNVNKASVIAENRLEDHTQDTHSKIERAELIQKIWMTFEKLSAKEVAILRLRFGLADDEKDHEKYPITQKELSALKGGRGLE